MKCELCPRKCGADRDSGEKGFCGMGSMIKAARADLHFWEEPCISGTRGSGAVFFSGCVMKCAYCQNFEISNGGFGKEITVSRLSEIFLELWQRGAHNINLVNPTHFVPQILKALDEAKSKGLDIPVVYNSGGYERVETLKMLSGYVDIYLPDIKYCSESAAMELSGAPRYFETALSAVDEMVRQTGVPKLSEDGLLKRGTVIRHMVLPWLYKDSSKVIRQVGRRYGNKVLFSLMSQYTPAGRVLAEESFKRYNRRITTFEYQKALDEVYAAGLRGYMQERSSAKEEFTPDFDLTGICPSKKRSV